MLAFRTPFCGCAVKFSPFYTGRILVATAETVDDFDLRQYRVGSGNGRLHVLDFDTASGVISEFNSFATAAGIYDCAWSKSVDRLAVTAAADGSVNLWNTSSPSSANPVGSFHEHSRDVLSVDWNHGGRDVFLTASLDGSVKLWNPQHPASLRTFRGHDDGVNAASWNRLNADVFAAAENRTARVWDLRSPIPSNDLYFHIGKVVSCDWNKFDEYCLVTSSADHYIRVWDIRRHSEPVATIDCHGFSVNKVRFSPHQQSVLVSCPGSLETRLFAWDYRLQDPLLTRYDHHDDLPIGVDMSEHIPGLLVSCGRDKLAFVWHQGTITSPIISSSL